MLFLNFIKDVIFRIYSVIRALLRLCLITFTFFISGLDCVLFGRSEICNYQLLSIPQAIDAEKVAYIDKLQAETGNIPADQYMTEDEYIEGIEDLIDEDDLDDEDDKGGGRRGR